MKTKYLLLLTAVLLAACNSKNTPSPAPNWQAEVETLTEAPHWQVANTDLFPSSMTITAMVPVSKHTDRDTVAALLCDSDEVLGVCSSEGKDYFALYVHGPKSEGSNRAFRLCYYSDMEKQLYVSYVEEGLLFENDAVRGTALSPTQFTWIPCGTHSRVRRVVAESPEGCWHPGDELALFVGDRCRCAVRPYEKDGQSPDCELWLPYDLGEEEAECRYYNAATEKITSSRVRIAELGY